ncbi:cytochrome c biogenesis CcdA family protein [Metabacillus rhizolycopersici]|uniref:Cytochrome c biogenesis protein CcdA n=1 Tax=Metabacillus rhizolycopersici TaxID=2875709 RepID=A0ABS7UNI6_9BACI|nr:cytochrome c biogenesis protein CcdA [Metabacillus rhizolycopersici]MBZ5749597.1 cytochrome c biogenesis protein CcdA [Metabacillus rhizolycopersici]
MEDISIWVAFIGGLLAFISPCCLPLYPSFISYITGVTVGELKNQQGHSNSRKIVLLHSIYFSIGFTIVYFALGFSASFIGKIFSNYNDLIRMLGGIFLVTMGTFMLDIFKPSFLMKEHRFQYTKRKVGFFNSVIVGIVFGAGWSPCIGPIFGAIMYANIMYPAQTFFNIIAYSLGFCLPFIIMAFFMSKIKLIVKYSGLFMKIGGVLMIIIGLMVFFDKMTYVTIWGSQIQYFFEGMLNK